MFSDEVFEEFPGSVTNGELGLKRCLKRLGYKWSWQVEYIIES